MDKVFIVVKITYDIDIILDKESFLYEFIAAFDSREKGEEFIANCYSKYGDPFIYQDRYFARCGRADPKDMILLFEMDINEPYINENDKVIKAPPIYFKSPINRVVMSI